MPRGSRLRRTLLRVVFLLVLVELLCHLALFGAKRLAGLEYVPIRATGLSEQQRRDLGRLLAEATNYLRGDAELGWTIREGGGSGLYVANAEGVRAPRTYGEQAPDGKLRLLCVGDSFTHCDEVAAEETWQSQLEAMRPQLEVVNGGVPGFGPDQALLRHRHLVARFKPQVAVMGFMSENLGRVVNVFRPFYDPNTGIPLGKPRFRLGAPGLELLPNPVRGPAEIERLLAGDAALFAAMGENDYWYQVMPHAAWIDVAGTVRLTKLLRFAVLRRLSPTSLVDAKGDYRPGTEALATTAAILDAFASEARAAGALPILVLFPSVKDVQRRARPYGELQRLLAAKGHRVVDVWSALPESAAQSRGMPGGHYDAAANGHVARGLADYLAGSGLGDRAAVRAALEQAK